MAGEATGHTLRLATLQQDRRQIPSGHIPPNTPIHTLMEPASALPQATHPTAMPCWMPQEKPGTHIPHNLKSRNPLLLPAGIFGETRPKRPFAMQCAITLLSCLCLARQRAKTPVAAGVRKGLSRPIPSRNPHIHRPLPSSNSAVGAWLCVLCVDVEGGVCRKFALSSLVLAEELCHDLLQLGSVALDRGQSLGDPRQADLVVGLRSAVQIIPEPVLLDDLAAVPNLVEPESSGRSLKKVTKT